MSEVFSDAQWGGGLLSISEVAGRLGMTTAALRSWQRRYGLGPAGRSPGGHRRFTADDLRRLLIVKEMIRQGTRPSVAANAVLTASPDDVTELGLNLPLNTGESSSSKSAGLDLPTGAGVATRALARAAVRLEADVMMGQISDHCIKHGVTATWNEVLLPVLIAAGRSWAATGRDMDLEHVLSQAVEDAFVAYRRFLPRIVPARPVIFACTSSEHHTLPIHALATALAEHRMPSLVLGSRVPVAAVASAMSRSQARAVFLWRHSSKPQDDEDDLNAFVRAAGPVPVFVGGAGWGQLPQPQRVFQTYSLEDATERLIT